ncbi:hypothetical protein CNMCM7691_005748 [Aspergillus felis]|uniref:FAD dependent oxidoreductase domain-containing protein n=1 Tax=Aspergillus felis TaxID=1287682 RepID=A0A8H6QPU9_9EURO|nr:hypothetical protein CNMCM7691_005748 [Aspergillus felis]
MTDFPNTYDVAVIGGGPIGLSAAYEVAKQDHSVVVLERNNFFNQAGSSGDLPRMFRTMYTEEFMADLALESIDSWKNLEKDAGENLRLMTGLLNFGDPNYRPGGPEGTLLDPIKNLDRLKMKYEKLSKDNIEDRYPFRQLPDEYVGIHAPDNGVINVPLLVRTLYRLCRDKGASLKEYTHVRRLEPDGQGWNICATEKGFPVAYHARKIIITCGAYVNHILRPSFNVQLQLDIWEMVASYWSLKAGSDGTKFPSMWFQFQGDVNGKSQLFYGFPALPWGPPDVARIAVDAATRHIEDPDDRSPSQVCADDIANTRLKDMAINGGSSYARPEFSISRRDPDGNRLLKEYPSRADTKAGILSQEPAQGSSISNA